MTVLCVLGPSQNRVTCEMLKNVNGIINMYCKAPRYNITEIITTNATGVPAQAVHYAKKHNIPVKKYEEESFGSYNNLYKYLIKRSDLLLLFTLNDQSPLIVRSAEYAVNRNVTTNVIQLVF